MSTSIYRDNTWKLLIATIATDSTFTLGIFVIFMLSVGLQLSQISLIISLQIVIYSLGALPGGILADRFGKKQALLFGGALFLLGSIIFAVGQNFYWFLVGYLFIGMGMALKQSNQYALLYESLEQDDRVEDYKRIAGKIDLFTNIFWVVSSIVGGLLYVLNHRLPFYGEILVALSGFISIILLTNTPIVKHNAVLIERLKSALKTTFSTKNFSKIFIFSALIGSIALITIQYTQPLYKSVHIPEAYFGFIAAVFFIMRGLGSWYSSRLGKFFSVDKYLVLHATTFGLFLVLLQRLGSIFFILPAFAILYFLRGLYNPTISTYINDRIQPHERATVLSINNQLLTLMTSVSLIGLGFIATLYGLQTVFFVISVLSLILLIAYVLSLRKVETG